MPFYPADAPVPAGLRTDDVVLRPLTAADTDRDYEAVMATQEQLRWRGSGTWPRPDFTLEENRADLEMHDADFQARRGFTYTVRNLEETRCLGCVYFYPLARAMRRWGADDAAVACVGDHEAMAWFWVRPDGVDDDLDRRLLAALRTWLRDDFAFSRVAFETWEADERQQALLQDAGLRLVWSNPVANTRVLHFA